MIDRVIVKGFRCFEHLDFQPQPKLNILIGGNEAGKSTLLEAIGMALTGRAQGRWAGDELNPHWFFRPVVLDFFERCRRGDTSAPPSFLIELFLDPQNDDLQMLRGVHNSLDHDARRARRRPRTTPRTSRPT